MGIQFMSEENAKSVLSSLNGNTGQVPETLTIKLQTLWKDWFNYTKSQERWLLKLERPQKTHGLKEKESRYPVYISLNVRNLRKES